MFFSKVLASNFKGLVARSEIGIISQTPALSQVKHTSNILCWTSRRKDVKTPCLWRHFSSTTEVCQNQDAIGFDRRRNEQLKPTITIKNVNTLLEEKSLEIHWNEEGASGAPKLFPFVWLRDHCQCARCFQPSSRSRSMLFDHLSLDVAPTNFEVKNDSVLEVKWSDGHTSPYTSDWLHERGFDRSTSMKQRSSAYKLDKILWGSEILENLPMANFNELMMDDVALLAWLQQLEVFGFVLINNAPCEYGKVGRLAARVAFIKKTHYGKEFSVKAKPNPSNVAYSNGPLQLHTDLPYYEYKPCLQLIHCIIQFDRPGAESLITNAEYVAQELKQKHPEMFKTLSETNVDWTDIGEDEGREFFKISRQPVICLDSEGNISRMNVSHPQRDSFFNVDFQTVFEWYEAFKTFHNMLYDPKYCLQFKMTQGTIQSFDNLRIVHGRKGYEEGIGERELEGCYMDWDEVRSKRRVLERQFGLPSKHWYQQRELSNSPGLKLTPIQD